MTCNSQRQANAKHCFVCGVANPFGLRLVFYTQSNGEVTADIVLPDHFEGYPGVIHGGIIAAMLDEAAGRAFLGGETPRFMYTVKLEVRYRKNTPPGRSLRLVGTPGKTRGRTAEAKAALFDEHGTLLAEADAILVDIQRDSLSPDELAQVGWRVYSDEELQLFRKS